MKYLLLQNGGYFHTFSLNLLQTLEIIILEYTDENTYKNYNNVLRTQIFFMHKKLFFSQNYNGYFFNNLFHFSRFDHHENNLLHATYTPTNSKG